ASRCAAGVVSAGRGVAQCAYAPCPALQGRHAYHSPAHPRSSRAHGNRAPAGQSYERELERLRPKRKSRGGDFYRTQGVRLGKRFARSLVNSTLEGVTQHGDAFRLLGFSKLATLRELGHRLGVV